MAMQRSSSSVVDVFSYDVFLSFRGEDTRFGFTGNLYSALRKRGIRTFMDDQELAKGDEITSALERAIQESRIVIIVISQNYASSSFCLDELAHILNLKGKGLLVLPVFYLVEPSDVRYHRGSFAEALAAHEKKHSEKLEKWKMALKQVARLSGYHFNHGYEHVLIEEIVKDVSGKFNRSEESNDERKVGGRRFKKVVNEVSTYFLKLPLNFEVMGSKKDPSVKFGYDNRRC